MATNITRLALTTLAARVAATVPTERPDLAFRIHTYDSVQAAKLPGQFRLCNLGYASDQQLERLTGITERGEFRRLVDLMVIYPVVNKNWQETQIIMASDADDLVIQLVNPLSHVSASNGQLFSVDLVGMTTLAIEEVEDTAIMSLQFEIRYRRN